MKRFLLLLLVLAPPSVFVAAADVPDLAPIKKWIAGQESVRTVQADFVQTRTYRALRDPLAAKGRLWFGAPGNLRWEIGDPPKMIYLRKGDSALVIQPARRRAERVPVAAKPGANPRAFAAPSFPLAKDFASFNEQFEVLSVTTAPGGHCHFEMQPRDVQAQKFVTAIKIDFETSGGQLTAFEIALRDGSSMRQEFTNIRVNQKLPSTAFDYDLTGLELVEGKQ